MAIEQQLNFQPADPLQDQESFSQLMGHIMRWAKSPDVDPCISSFTAAIAPIYGASQTHHSLLLHVTRILTVIAQDPRFRFSFTPDMMTDLLAAPWQIHARHDASIRGDDELQMSGSDYVNGLIIHLWSLIRNSPTGRLTEKDFLTHFDPVVRALMNYVKQNGSKDITFKKLGLVLNPVFGHTITDPIDITGIVLQAFETAQADERFQIRPLPMKEVLAAPVKGPFGLLGFMPRYTDLLKAEDFYLSMAKLAISHMAVAKIDWCLDEFPELKK